MIERAKARGESESARARKRGWRERASERASERERERERERLYEETMSITRRPRRGPVKFLGKCSRGDPVGATGPYLRLKMVSGFH